MKLFTSLLLSALSLFLIPTSALLADDSTATQGLQLDESQNGKTFSVQQNQEVIVTLEDRSASTGYAWDRDTSNISFLKLERTSVLPPSSNLMGAAAKKKWFFKVTGTPQLEGDLIFTEKRPWENDSSLLPKTVTFDLKLVAASNTSTTTSDSDSQNLSRVAD